MAKIKICNLLRVPLFLFLSATKTAAQRVLFYRRVSGVWEFLLATQEGSALDYLRELIVLERTPFPPSSGNST
ncbi:MAG: hypothetical protein ABJC04_10045 [Verrucomicrobiota bacterium]